MPPPTRMANVLQFDPTFPGETVAADAIRAAITRRVRWGTPLNKVMHGLAVLAKYHVKAVEIEFHPNIGFGRAGRYTIFIDSSVVIADQVVATFWHELGHVVGMNYFNDSSEGWAHMFGSWVGEDAPPGDSEGSAWNRLEAALDLYNFYMSPPIKVGA